MFAVLMIINNNASSESALTAIYKLNKVTYKIADEKMRAEVEKESFNLELKAGQRCDNQDL